MQCPKCTYVRTALDSVVPEWQCPKCNVVYSKFRASANKRIRISMTSGKQVSVREIKLHDVSLQHKLDVLRKSIDQNFKGYSTGIGFIGSLESVIEASIVTGVIEGVVSSAMASTGMNQLKEAALIYRKLQETAVYVSVGAIENIQYPLLHLWRTSSSKNPDRSELSHMPITFVSVRSDEGESIIIWDKVEQYEYIGSTESN